MKWFVLFLGMFSAPTDSSINAEGRVLEHIFANYSPNVRPVFNHSKPVAVQFGLKLRQIMDVDMVNEVLTTRVWIRMFWNSELTTWDPNRFGGVKSINIEPNKLWVPDIINYNSASKSTAGGSFYKTLDTKVIVEYTGRTIWLSPTILKTECMIDVRFFPFDSHECRLIFGSWTHHNNKIFTQLSQNNVDIEAFSGDKEWVLEDTAAKVEITKFNCCPEKYSVVTFSLFIKRRAMFYVFNLIIPCGLITLLSLFSFILPPNSGERVSFVMTILLSLSVYMLIVTEKIPQSAEIPISSKLFMCMMVEIALSLVATCFIIRFHNQSSPLPPVFKVVVNHWIARLLRMKNTDSEEDNDDSKLHGKRATKYFKNQVLNCKEDDGVFATPLDLENILSTIIAEKDKKSEKSDNYQSDDNTKESGELVKVAVKEFSKLPVKVHENKQHETLQCEWIFAAKVLDRFFLLILCISICVTFVWISISAPSGSVIY